MGRTYTLDQKTRALEIYVAQGPCRSARETGVTKPTIIRWAKAAGLVPPTENITDGVKAQEARIAAKRAALKELLITKALDLATRMDEMHIDFKGNHANEVKYPKAPAAACQHYATSIGILIDKFRLENGEATGREEVITIDAVDREIAKLERELAARPPVDARTAETN
ncbi:MAG: hypothetical protein JXA87_02185 [Thermoleophilia bacterium]|nr:hypothetical protein [Thermoleophilia bacterium]